MTSSQKHIARQPLEIWLSGQNGYVLLVKTVFECDVHDKLFLGTELRLCPPAWFPPCGWVLYLSPVQRKLSIIQDFFGCDSRACANHP